MMDQCPRCEREKPPFEWLPHRCPAGINRFEYEPDDEELAYHWQMIWTGAL